MILQLKNICCHSDKLPHYLHFQDHSRYVQSVRYSPDGVFWVSAGFDGKMYLYDGKDSELISEFVDVKG